MSLNFVQYSNNARQKNISQFGGYNHRSVINEAEFYDMKNMSSDYFPCIGTRKPRGSVEKTLTKPNGIFHKNGLVYVDGTGFYYKGQKKFDVADSKKNMVGMGAYIRIFPDKMYFNTSNDEHGYMEKSYEPEGDAVFTPISDNSAYTKIQADGISEAFAVYDSVTIEGCDIDDFNKTAIIQDINTDEDYIVITGILEEFDEEQISWNQSTDAEYKMKNNHLRITCTGIERFEGRKIVISRCSKDTVDGTYEVLAAGDNWIEIDQEISETFIQRNNLTIKTVDLYTQTSGLSFTRKVPDMDFVCEQDNRIWGCSSENHEIYASKLGDPFNWNNYEGISTDSYAVTVGSDGDFTGCIGHLGNILFFKEHTIHKIYGNKPSNFQVNEYTLPGVASGSSRSICVVDETLFYKGVDGIYMYDGSSPVNISGGIKEKFTEAAASQCDGKYYISLKNGSGIWSLFVWDKDHSMWHREDNTSMKDAVYGAGKLYYLNASNKILTIRNDDNQETFDWMLESGNLMEDTFNKKYITKLMFHFKLEAGSEANIFIKYDDEEIWKRVHIIRSTNKKSYVVPIIPRRCTQMRFRIEGKGKAELFGISKYVEEGSEM